MSWAESRADSLDLTSDREVLDLGMLIQSPCAKSCRESYCACMSVEAVGEGMRRGLKVAEPAESCGDCCKEDTGRASNEMLPQGRLA